MLPVVLWECLWVICFDWVSVRILDLQTNVIPWSLTVEKLPAMQETRFQSLGQEDPLEKSMAIHSCIIAWGTPWTGECGRLQSIGSQRVWHNWIDLAQHSTHTQLLTDPMTSKFQFTNSKSHFMYICIFLERKSTYFLGFEKGTSLQNAKNQWNTYK